uniref:Acetyltransferase component of pyruvate dehydrogenase complex n=1 Tax=Paeonia suffruticosa TaxID=45171 RepID=A0A126DHL8_PAESU|nr:dihydrolipoyllysine-residue acetyltransferase [Paeonia suffruticosa]
MTYASQILIHSKKLRNAPNLLRHDRTPLVRWFSKDASPSILKSDDLLMTASTTASSSQSCRAISPGVLTKSLVGMQKGNVSRTVMNTGIPMAGLVFNKSCSCSQVHPRRGFSSNSGLPPHQEIGMPSLSPTMTEGNIARWLKKEGDQVSTGEVLCEVETDKATVEMECMEEGYLAKIIHGDGAKEIKVGEVIAVTVEEEGDIAKFKDYSPSAPDAPAAADKETSVPTPPKKEVVEEPVSSPEPKVSKTSAPPPAEDRIFASPLAKKLAEDHNVPLSSIKGTGPDGRIVKADIEDYLASGAKGVSATPPKAKDATTAAALDYTDLPHTQIRKVTASRLLLSKQTIPHYYLTVDTCVDKLMDLRGQLNSLQEASGGKRLSVNDLVIKAAALALRKVPQCNSSWTNDYIRQFHNVNINVAVQTDNGLYVPVIRDADKKGLSTISEEIKHLAQKAKENNLKPEDFEGGTFTVSNLGGPFGIKQFCAIINPPQSGILAVGSA